MSILLAPALLLFAQEGDDAYTPRVEPASSEAREAMTRFELPEGFELELFAAEPHLANPVCFYVDARGDCYVAETFRHTDGVTDMRQHMGWLHDELANESVPDRVAMLRKHEGERVEAGYAVEHERVRLIRDTDGDGRADEATVFADGFNAIPDGIGAGLLSNGGDVYYTCMPHLWRLRDEDGDGRADVREKLSSGYGVHIALLGHDLHGLRIGPDGRLYFSCGDRGFRVETEDGVIAHPHTGAVLRCELDGSKLEVFATGLRNPQELVFDAHGNLWTGDNNSDGGDKARWVHVVEGAESGWRFYYQYVTRPTLRGPWNDEKLWHPWHEGQAAYILPPVANLADGPSGLTYNPYSNAPDGQREHFYLCDFRGDPKLSGIHAFDVRPKGAGFELGEVERWVWGSLVTDCDFGPEGALYFSDWVFGWNKTGKGRIYRLTQPGEPAEREIAWTREVFSQGFAGTEADMVGAFMTRPDLRVRQEAHLELASRGAEGVAVLERYAHYEHDPLVRLHAVWGLGVASRADRGVLAFVRTLLREDDPEVRAQAARVLGDERDADATGALIEALRDESARVRMYAAIGLGRIGDTRAVEPLFALLREAGTSDPTLRHAGVMGLVGCADPRLLHDVAERESSVHALMGACLALRRMKDHRITIFLAYEPVLAAEAARAIYDVPIDSAMGTLAGFLEDARGNAFVRRAMCANFRMGTETHARRLAAFAGDAEREERHRAEALDLLADWASPGPVDRVLGNWRPLDEREASFLPAIALELGDAMDAAPAGVAAVWIALVRRTGTTAAAPRLAGWVRDARRASSTRVAAFEALRRIDPGSFEALVATALGDRDAELRATALDALPEISIERALPVFEEVLATGTISEQRAVYRALARTNDPRAEAIFQGQLGGRVRVNTVPEEVALDLMIAAEQSNYPAVRHNAKRYREVRANVQDPELAPYYWSVYGGDAQKGRRIFDGKAELSCLRCHPRGEDAATGVGPDLRGIGARLTRRQILESIVLPNARIAPGYEGHLVRLVDETVIAGRVLEETGELLRIQDSDGVVHEIAVGDIEARRPDLSAMPEGHDEHLTREEMRDLIEYVYGL